MKEWLLVIIVAMLSGCSFVNTVGMKWANSDIKPVWLSEHTSLPLSAHFEGEKSYVYVDIDGHHLKMLIDSGASFSALFDTPRVEKMNLPRQAELLIGGWGDEKSSIAYKTQVKLLDLGSVSFKNIVLAVIPISTSKYYLRSDEATFDGIIGHDVMRHFAWTFDKITEQIVISNKAHLRQFYSHAVPFSRSLSKLSILAKFQLTTEHAVDMPIVIDTGSRHYLKLSAQYIENHKLDMGRLVEAADFGLSGIAHHQRGNIKSIQIADLVVTNVKANFIPTEDEDELWIIGNAFLNQFVSTIDYHTNTLYLQPREQGFQSRYNLSGLELRKLVSGYFVVRSVASRSKSTGLKVGDIITKLNDQDTPELSMDDWLDISNQAKEHQLCWAHSPVNQLSLDKQQCKTVTFSNITGFNIVN
ncbi:aspartyl protease family protein [Pseudoalteromonas sp. S16_S37]|uniref:aspartyl protease family protein n=1 Tax=Pseudoalteromonas sp. S16_S37 TaxID=2720228 RepID=UPI0016801C47|nr:aspartyl protease family protein [Pseudoalteromonas sp. S16_S37]MBD1583995.1 hypothetical protein [Pseudoalteromonas sp. S16_S37]